MKIQLDDLVIGGLRLRVTPEAPSFKVQIELGNRIVYQEDAEKGDSVPYLLAGAVERLLRQVFPMKAEPAFGLDPEDLAFIVKRLKETLSEGDSWKGSD